MRPLTDHDIDNAFKRITNVLEAKGLSIDRIKELHSLTDQFLIFGEYISNQENTDANRVIDAMIIASIIADEVRTEIMATNEG